MDSVGGFKISSPVFSLSWRPKVLRTVILCAIYIYSLIRNNRKNKKVENIMPKTNMKVLTMKSTTRHTE